MSAGKRRVYYTTRIDSEQSDLTDNPLGQPSSYPTSYSPDVLFGIPRETARRALGLENALPFSGTDIWTAWELSWLDDDGRPSVAIATLTFPADSGHIIESKSLKLYLNSLAQTRYVNANAIQTTIARDLSAVARAPVGVVLTHDDHWLSHFIPANLPGLCIDNEGGDFSSPTVEPSLLSASSRERSEEILSTNLLRSLCPVTGQPDTGSLVIDYRGPRIDRGGLA